MSYVVIRIYFNHLGRSERVVLIAGSGDSKRDLECINFCSKMQIPVPRLKTRKMGQLWRQVRIAKDAVLV